MESPQHKFRRLRPDRVKQIERASKLRRKYGLTLDAWNELATRQSFACAVCGVPQTEMERGLFVDHDHKTGRVRGLLCNPCNRGLGYFRDRPDLLQKAKDYLNGLS